MDSLPHRYSLILLLLAFAYTSFAGYTDPVPAFDESEIIKRLEMMDSEVAQPRYDVVVRSYLKTYLVNHRKKAEKILGRRIIYFPIFEDYLKQNQIPTDLKYLAIVESALEPRAISRVGAGGIWQFMPGTARNYGLQVDAQVDERADPHKATQAAAEHLEDLYKKFSDWELAIAAYNSGSGRVSRAVKRGRSTSYWKIRAYLPSETRNYVPAFIAASYLVKYFENHGLTPEYPDMDLQMTETISIFQDITFEEVARVTGVSEEVIAKLNPAFLKSVVPASVKGYYFTLPRRVMKNFRAFLESDRPDYEAKQGMIAAPVMIGRSREMFSPDFTRSAYQVQEGETLETLAQRLHCSVYQIRAWNNMTPSQEVSPGQNLVVFQLKETLPVVAAMVRVEALEALPAATLAPVFTQEESTNPVLPITALRDNSFVYYQVRKAESIMDISLRFRIDIEQLRRLNQIYNFRNLKPGTVVKLAEFEE